MKKRFKCTVERTDEYIIEFDDEIINQEWLDEFYENQIRFKELKEHAEHLSQLKARSDNIFMEGYGIPLVNGKSLHFADEHSIEKGINIIIVSEDEMCDVDVEEIK